MLARGGVASAQGNLTVMGNAYLQSNAYLTQPMTGNVGIGTQNPYTKLHIHDGTDQYAGITLTGGTTNLNQAFIRYSEAGQYLSLSMGAFTNNHLVVANIGRVGIGTTNPDNLLTVNGTADKPGGGSWGSYSDERLKDVEGEFQAGLVAVLQLQPVRYRYKKHNALGIRDRKEHVGFSAQEVERVIPEAVSKNSKGYRLVDNDPILWTMLNAIKAQQALIRELAEKVRLLEAHSK